jgi:hypothetical protein
MTTDPLLAVTGALEPADRTAIELDWARVNPHQAGAQAADILDMLAQHDAHLDQIEPFFEAHKDLIGRPGSGYAALALIRLNRPLTRLAVVVLLIRAGLGPEVGPADLAALAVQLADLDMAVRELGRYATHTGQDTVAAALWGLDDDLRFAAAKLRALKEKL